VPKYINTCAVNQQYDYFYQICLCKVGYQWVNGACQVNTTCLDVNSNWNGVKCVCNEAYILYQGACRAIATPLPICPSNSYFNGIFCTCNDGFYELWKGYCSQCPYNTIWDGSSCKASLVCLEGYVYNNITRQCDAKGINCGQNAKWNGAMCCCL